MSGCDLASPGAGYEQLLKPKGGEGLLIKGRKLHKVESPMMSVAYELAYYIIKHG
jgi:hypothetical protein